MAGLRPGRCVGGCFAWGLSRQVEAGGSSRRGRGHGSGRRTGVPLTRSRLAYAHHRAVVFEMRTAIRALQTSVAIDIH
jgi:hypothetical protein